jgi:hypothetical protein
VTDLSNLHILGVETSIQAGRLRETKETWHLHGQQL